MVQDEMRVCMSQPHCRCGADDEYSCNCMRGRRHRDGRFRCKYCRRVLVTILQYEKRCA